MIEIEKLEKMARGVRKKMISVADHCHNEVHWGGSLSCVEILLSIIRDVSNISALRTEDGKRDILIVSKGHAALAYYAVLDECGLIHTPFIEQFQKNGSQYTEELTMNKDLFIECSTGSLGLGLPFAVGLAIRNKKEGNDKKIFCVVGDGECGEGSNWESVMLAFQFKLDNIVLVIDRNDLQLDGYTKAIIDQSKLPDKLAAFGWEVKEADGHDFGSLRNAFLTTHKVPLAVISNTVKGKGISFMENDFTWHEKILCGKLLHLAKQEVGLI